MVLVLGCVFTFKFWLLPMRVTGISMEPTYRDRQLNFINRLAYKSSSPQRGHVVGIRTTGLRILVLKRVIGLPGERVRIRRGTVYINGEPLNEPYVNGERAPWRKEEILLGEDEYLVIGDNRSMSAEDHVWGVIPRERIVGRILK